MKKVDMSGNKLLILGLLECFSVTEYLTGRGNRKTEKPRCICGAIRVETFDKRKRKIGSELFERSKPECQKLFWHFDRRLVSR